MAKVSGATELQHTEHNVMIIFIELIGKCDDWTPVEKRWNKDPTTVFVRSILNSVHLHAQ